MQLRATLGSVNAGDRKAFRRLVGTQQSKFPTACDEAGLAGPGAAGVTPAALAAPVGRI